MHIYLHTHTYIDVEVFKPRHVSRLPTVQTEVDAITGTAMKLIDYIPRTSGHVQAKTRPNDHVISFFEIAQSRAVAVDD